MATLTLIYCFQCILAAVIVVAVKGVLLQILDFPGYFKKSMLDGLLWFGTFLGVILTAIDKGLYVCIGLTIFVMVYRNYTISIVEMDDDDLRYNLAVKAIFLSYFELTNLIYI